MDGPASTRNGSNRRDAVAARPSGQAIALTMPAGTKNCRLGRPAKRRSSRTKSVVRHSSSSRAWMSVGGLALRVK